MVKPPRTLFVPYPFGYPLGKPNKPKFQHRIILAALQLLATKDTLPLLIDFQK